MGHCRVSSMGTGKSLLKYNVCYKTSKHKDALFKSIVFSKIGWDFKMLSISADCLEILKLEGETFSKLAENLIFNSYLQIVNVSKC